MDTMLPIGSVVELKGEKDKIVIIGHLHQLVVDNQLSVAQYTGVEYANGFRNEGQIYYFDEDKIDSLYFSGFAIETDRLYLKVIHDVYKEIEKTNDIKKSMDNVLNKYYGEDEEKKKEILKNTQLYYLDSEGDSNE